MNDSPNRDVEVFTEALQLPVDERAAYLERACGSDGDLRRKVEALLEGHDQAGDFLEDSPQKTLTQARPGVCAGEKPGDRISHYKLLQQIGEGGCGIVFMAEQEEPVRRRVALKIIKPGMDTKSVIARFEAERQALALMDHPNIAKMFDAGATESGRPYFVMELVRGVKITEYCDQHSLTTEERLKLFVQVCQAVQHAHQKGIIHRDIKPSNILVTKSEQGDALPVVIDFGIAKATTNQQLTDKTLFTAFEMLIGTPAYMSPEQAALTNLDMDTRTDIYSLGVLLYELLTGSTPFDTGELLKAGLDEIRRVIREQEPSRPSTRLSQMTGADLTTIAQHHKSEPPTLIHAVRGDLDWIVMKALEKDRTRRYATSHGLALDVQRYLSGEPISARPPSKLYKFQKAVFRNKLLFTGIGVIVLLLIGSLIVISASLARERQARRDAETASAKSQQVTTFLKNMLNGDGPLNTLDKLGDTFDSQRKWSDAEAVRREALAGYYKEFGKENAVSLYALRRLGFTLEGETKWSEAETIWRESLVVWRKRGGDEETESMFALRSLGLTLLAEGKWPDAESVYREALTVSRKQGGSESPEAVSDLEHLASALLAQRKFGEAKKFLDEALTPVLVRQPSSANLLIRRVDLKGRQGRWREATADAVLLVQLQPAEHYNYHRLAALLVITHNGPGYEQLCQRILATFTNMMNPYVDERITQDCLLLPNSAVDLGLVDKLADTAVTRGSGETSLPYFQACKAMSEYRMGHFRKAIEWAEKAAKSPIAEPQAKAKAFAISAMANWQLGEKDAAHAALASGDTFAPKLAPDHDTEDLGGSWVAWLVARISLDEATALIQPGSTTNNNLNQPK